MSGVESGVGLLRRAASLMQERADNSATAMVGPLSWGSNFDAKDYLTTAHYQSWRPEVARAVADLLTVISWMPSSADPTDMAAALAVARAYLNEAAQEAAS